MIPPHYNTPDAASFKATSTLFRDGWTLHRVNELPSTNSAASRLPEWHAIRADTQKSGRGRTGRRWVSDQGGLWLSAVLPCPTSSAQWSLLPLAAGWSVVRALDQLGASDLRLRWPNDIMAGHRKLAGLLVERYNSQTAVVGIGLNVSNSPEASDQSLCGTTTRLVDLISTGCDLDQIANIVLRSIRRAHALLLNGEFPFIAKELNEHWSTPRLVAITLNGHAHPFTGLFTGIDDHGRLRLSTDYSSACVYDASQVSLMRELE